MTEISFYTHCGDQTSPFYSRDCYVRVPAGGVGQIVFAHLCTEQDSSVLDDAVHLLHNGSRKAGYTEWYGMHDGMAISLGWDWAELEDGDIRVLRVVLPRTNLMMTDTQGYDVPAEESAEEFLAAIDALPWQSQVRQAVHARTVSSAIMVRKNAH